MRLGTILILVAGVALAGCMGGGDAEQSVDLQCSDVGDEYAKGGMEGEHCPNETPLSDAARSS